LNLKLEKLQRDNLTFLVHENIKDALMKGHFMPGEKMGIRKIADEIGISPTPVREALLQLVSSHALEMKPAHSITVPVLTKETYLEIRDLRVILEGLAVEKATQHITRARIKKLSNIDACMIQAIKSGEYRKALEQNQAFHFILCQEAKMPLLLGMIEILWLRIGPSLNQIYPPPVPEPDIKNYHIQILEALNSGDAESARNAMKKDLIYGGSPLLEHLQKNEPK